MIYAHSLEGLTEEDWVEDRILPFSFLFLFLMGMKSLLFAQHWHWYKSWHENLCMESLVYLWEPTYYKFKRNERED